MSFGRFSLVSSDGTTLLAAGEIRLPIARRNGLPDDLIVGVRPEHTRLWNHGVALIGPFDGVVEYVEELGRETFLGVHASGDTRFVVQVEGRARIGLTLDSFELRGKEYHVRTTSIDRVSAAHKKRNVLLIGGGTALGAVIGGMAGGGKGALIGAGAGAGAGTAGAALTGKKQVGVAAETPLRFTLEAAVAI